MVLVASDLSHTGLSIVFVYGTLRRNRPNHHHLAKGPASVYFLGLATTEDPYPFVIGSQFNVPYLLHRKGEGKRVTGEIYAVDKEVLKRLDILEGCPDYYQRVPLPVHVLPEEVKFGTDRCIFPIKMEFSGAMMSAYCYFRLTYPPELLTLPHIEEYTDVHAREYVPRHLRGTGTSMLQIQRNLERDVQQGRKSLEQQHVRPQVISTC